MADVIRIVTFTTRATAGTQDITHPDIGSDFSAAVFFYGGFTADDADNAHGLIGCGFVAPDNGGAVTEEQAIGCAMEHGVDVSSDDGTHHSITACIVVPNGNPPGAADVVAAYSATIVGGVRLNFTTTNVQVKMTAVLFAGLARAAVGDGTSTTSPLSENVGGTTDFEPDVVLFLSTSGSLSSIVPNASPNLGFAVNGGGQVTAGVDADDASTTTDSDGYVVSNRGAAAVTVAGRALETVNVTAFVSTGFSHVASAGSPSWHYLALKFTDPALNIVCDNLAVSGAAGTQSFSVGFQPQIVLGISTLIAAEDTLADGATAGAMGYFAFSSSYARAYSARQQEGQVLSGAPVTQASSRQGDHAVLTLTHLGAVAQQASLVGMTGVGFDLSFSTATAGFLTVLAIGAGSQDLVQSDSETISDEVTMAGVLGALSDSETITDLAVIFTTDVSVTGGASGASLQGGAERGTSYSGGAEAGTVF